VSPRKRQPAPTDHATMLDLALEDLQRTASQGRELLSRHPDRAHAALDLLLFNVGCWEVRWLNVATDATIGASLDVMPLADEEGVSTLDLESAMAMSERAKELVEMPAESRRAGRGHREVSGQVGHGQAAM
jgi:hypothetical protein